MLSEKIEINEWSANPLVSFTGDTQIEFLDLSPEVVNSKILIVECTYLDERKSIKNARDWGHIHFDELLPRLKEIKSEKIFLTHISSRYKISEAKKILQKKVEAVDSDLWERIELFPY